MPGSGALSVMTSRFSRLSSSVRGRIGGRSMQGITLGAAIRALPRRAGDRSFWMEGAELGLSAVYDRIGGDGIDVIEQDWDTLIVLDACRYDLFEAHRPADWPAAIRVRSRASHTTGWYQTNFTEGPYLDTVLVTANPKAVQERGDAFHDVVKVYETDWDEKNGTVMPDAMARATIEAHERYPDKRILSHWIQPHYPFVGGDSLGYDFFGESIWHDLRRGHLDPATVYADYAATLDLAIPYVQEVLDAVDGRVVVTADHGNAFGERPWFYPFRLYGHPRGILHPSIVDVPWAVIDCGPRRRITEGEARTVSAGDDDDVEARLASLGYL